jgi:hypothetical protein
MVRPEALTLIERIVPNQSNHQFSNSGAFDALAERNFGWFRQH